MTDDDARPSAVRRGADPTARTYSTVHRMVVEHLGHMTRAEQCSCPEVSDTLAELDPAALLDLTILACTTAGALWHELHGHYALDRARFSEQLAHGVLT